MRVEFASVLLRHGMELEGGIHPIPQLGKFVHVFQVVNTCKPHSSKGKYATNWRGQI